MSGAGGAGYAGQLGPSATNSRFTVTEGLVWQVLRTLQTASLVQVKAVTGVGVNPVGLVDVLPLVNMQDGLGNTIKHGIINGVPYFRLQGGTNAVICDPVVGDIGLAIFASRDISAVKNTKKQSNPGSRRLFDWSDGLYIGGFLNGTPVQYVEFTADGLKLHDKHGNEIVTTGAGVTVTDAVNGNSIVLDSAGAKINGVLFDRSQNITNVTNITAKDGVDLTGHVHTGVTTGSGNTGGPTG